MWQTEQQGEVAGLLAQAVYSCISYDQNLMTDSIIIILSFRPSLICDSTVEHPSSSMPPLPVLSRHADIVTYVHGSCSGSAPFCIYY